MDIMEKIHEEQLKKFKLLIESNESMSITYYLCLFLGSFLGPECFPQTKDELTKCDEKKLAVYFDSVIDSVSLCGQEIDFFHEMVKLKTSENYIESCIEAYKKIDGLERCQLGGNILKFLECSKEVDLSI